MHGSRPSTTRAVEKPASSGHTADLSLADVVMRGMSRIDLTLMNLNPGMKIVRMSGCIAEPLSERGGLTTLLEKSFTRSDLLRRDQRTADPKHGLARTELWDRARPGH